MTGWLLFNDRPVTMTLMQKITPEIEAQRSRLRATWTAGDFGVIARSFAAGARDFVGRLNITAGMKVLDLACGTGNQSLPAARMGADVTGIDLAPNLIEQAVANATAEGLKIKFEVGDAEALPYADGEFDLVMSMFGAMFAPRPEVVISEMLRVCKSGARIAMANWTASGFGGEIARVNAKYVAPPAGFVSPILWGDEDTVRQRFGDRVADLKMTRRPMPMIYPFGPAEVIRSMRENFGPTIMSFASLTEADRQALHNDMVDIWTKHNEAADGTTFVTSEYLEVIAVKNS